MDAVVLYKIVSLPKNYKNRVHCLWKLKSKLCPLSVFIKRKCECHKLTKSILSSPFSHCSPNKRCEARSHGKKKYQRIQFSSQTDKCRWIRQTGVSSQNWKINFRHRFTRFKWIRFHEITDRIMWPRSSHVSHHGECSRVFLIFN